MKRAAILIGTILLAGAMLPARHAPTRPAPADRVGHAGEPARWLERPGAATGLLTAGGSPAYPWKRRLRRAERFAAGRLGHVSFAVAGEDGKVRGHRAHRGFRSASVVKVMLMTAYLRSPDVRNRDLRGGDRALLEPMIRWSDDGTATAIRDKVGNDGLARLARKAGMRDFATHVVWGYTRISAFDQSRFMRRLQRFVPGRHRRYAFRLLERIVPAQRWGMPKSSPRGWRLFFKGGFVRSAGGWRIHQVAQLRRGGRRLGVAVLTDGNPSLGYGAGSIRGVVGRLLHGYR